MKTYNPNEIKNIALVGSAGSGKTTLAEAMMYEGGVIPRRGSVSAKNTSSDYRPVEQEYGSSVFPAVLYTEWKDQKLNFIDTPGADDFVGGVISALNVADTVLCVGRKRYVCTAFYGIPGERGSECGCHAGNAYERRSSGAL